MAYRPIIQPKGYKRSNTTTLMAKDGMNTRTLPQLLDTSVAQDITNYLISDEGQLVKRGGLEKIWEVAGSNAVTMLERFDSDTIIFGYSTTVARYTESTDTVTTIKGDFSANSGFQGIRYGAYFFVCNGVEKIWMIDNAYAITEVAASPICSVIKAIGNRLFAGNISTDATAVKYSEVDDGTNPPFAGWTEGTDATQAGTIAYRNAGTVKSIEPFGSYIVVLSDDGKFAFSIDQLDSGGTISKVDITQMSRLDFGGSNAAISTNQGLFYANEAGIWQMLDVGSENLPQSDQEGLTTHLLSTDYFDDLDLSDADMTYDAKNNLILLACAKDSDTNNYVLVYNVLNKSIMQIKGWNIRSFYNDNQTIYGGSAVATKVYKLFKGSDDDGLPIGTKYKQELTVGALDTRKVLTGIYVQGFLSDSTTININFDIYDKTGKPITDKLKLEWTAQRSEGAAKGWGQPSWGIPSWGGDEDSANLVESFDGLRPRISNFQRIILKISNSDSLPHTVNWLSIETREKARIRRRKLSDVT